ncbi:hypothetical protein J6590_004442 [Homalodisca vitripennis]|nr:hypothetical protein J6590_004442 [Homalodisca vitripennis]
MFLKSYDDNGGKQPHPRSSDPLSDHTVSMGPEDQTSTHGRSVRKSVVPEARAVRSLQWTRATPLVLLPPVSSAGVVVLTPALVSMGEYVKSYGSQGTAVQLSRETYSYQSLNGISTSPFTLQFRASF